MTDHLSWRAIFWVNLPLCAAAFLMSRRALRILPPRPAGRAKVDIPGAVLLTAAVVSALLVISRAGQGEALLSPLSVGLVLTCGAALALLAVQERRANFPMLPPRMFAEPVVVRGLALSFANSLVTFATLLLLPLHFQLAQGVSASGSGLLLTPFLLSFVILSYGGGQLSRRLGRTRGIMAVALGCCTLGTLLLSSIGSGTPPWLTMAWSLLTGAGIGLVQPNITVTIQNAADPRDVGIATGCMLLLRSIGGAFGATMSGAIIAWSLAAQSGLPAGMGAALLEGRGTMLASLDAGVRATVLGAVDSGFHIAFLAATAISALSLAIALTTRDLALRSA
jgi:MFS family permease